MVKQQVNNVTDTASREKETSQEATLPSVSEGSAREVQPKDMVINADFFSKLASAIASATVNQTRLAQTQKYRDELNDYASQNSSFRAEIRKRAYSLKTFTVHYRDMGDEILLLPYHDGKECVAKNFFFSFRLDKGRYCLFLHTANTGQFTHETEKDNAMYVSKPMGDPKYISERVVEMPAYKGSLIELARMSFLLFNTGYGHTHHMYVDTQTGFKEERA